MTYTHPSKRAMILYNTLRKLKANSPDGIVRCNQYELCTACGGIGTITLSKAINELTADERLIVEYNNNGTPNSFKLIETAESNFKP